MPTNLPAYRRDIKPDLRANSTEKRTSTFHQFSAWRIMFCLYKCFHSHNPAAKPGFPCMARTCRDSRCARFDLTNPVQPLHNTETCDMALPIADTTIRDFALDVGLQF